MFDDQAVADLSAAWDACSGQITALLAELVTLTSGTGNSAAIEAVVSAVNVQTKAMSDALAALQPAPAPAPAPAPSV